MQTSNIAIYTVKFYRTLTNEDTHTENVVLNDSEGIEQLRKELQESCENGLAGDFEIVSRFVIP